MLRNLTQVSQDSQTSGLNIQRLVNFLPVSFSTSDYLHLYVKSSRRALC